MRSNWEPIGGLLKFNTKDKMRLLPHPNWLYRANSIDSITLSQWHIGLILFNDVAGPTNLFQQEVFAFEISILILQNSNHISVSYAKGIGMWINLPTTNYSLTWYLIANDDRPTIYIWPTNCYITTLQIPHRRSHWTRMSDNWFALKSV